MERFVVFDVETPNHNNNRMSAIGVTVVEDGMITDEFYSLVDPETRFDPFNISLTGITPQMVRGQPTFAELWPKLEELFGQSILIAHNAPFDMGVLSKCLNAYRIAWRARVPYACTCQMGRRILPELPDHRLNTMSEHLGICLDHHNAASDSRACAELLLYYLNCGTNVRRFLRSYDTIMIKTVRDDYGYTYR